MPTADHSPVPDFDDVQLGSTPEDSPYVPPSTGKKGKKKKGKKNGAVSRAVEEEEAKAIEEITFPAPTVPEVEQKEEDWRRWDEGREVSLLDNDDVAAAEVAQAPAPVQALQTEAEVRLPVQEAEFHPPQPRRPSAPPIPQTQPPQASPRPSPRPAAAKLAYSPQSRPAAAYGSPPTQTHMMPPYRSNPPPSAMAARRESASHTSPRPRFVEPAAPPHMAQPHFYGLPDLFGQQKKDQGGKAAGSEGYCCVFDSFADAGDPGSNRRAKSALLVGSEGALEVYRVLPNKFEVVGRLEGLRGSVVGAKVVPHTDLNDVIQDIRPLVVLIVHGVMSDDSQEAEKGPMKYQTTVEVYSLQTQKQIATLYKTTPVAVDETSFRYGSSPPGPIGDLSIDARGRFITLASGKSGEIFVFSDCYTATNPKNDFRCIGKYWAWLQRPVDQGSRPQSSSDGGMAADEIEEKPGVPLFSLSNRWMAYVAPPTSSQVPITGSPLLLEENQNPLGLSAHLAPPQPPITCDVAGVDAEGTWSRISRQAAQGVVKYSQKGIDMGIQGWKELTNPTTQSGQPHGRSSSGEDRFPPTHAGPDDPRRLNRQPVIVCIVDLETLLDAEVNKPKYAPAPIATFALEDGCNFLSFSSSGLRLLTVSRKGEISTIWDLTQASHGVARFNSPPEDESEHGPCIKQILRIPRSSQSIVVDCAWTRDDDCLALLTTHGTVHLHEIPSQPPRKRRRRSTITAPQPAEKADATVGVSQGMSPPSSNGFLGSLKSGWQGISTQVNTMRSTNPVSSLGIPTTFAGFKETAASAGTAGRRAIAKGLSQGYSAAKSGASEYWHSEDNKIRQKALSEAASPGCMRWIKRQSGTLLAVACGGTVHLHPVQRIERMSGDAMVSGLKHDKYGKKHFDLPPIRTSMETNNTTNGGKPNTKKDGDCAKEGPHGFWSLKGRTIAMSDPKKIKAFLGKTDFANGPPYVPLHINPRYNFYTYDEGTPELARMRTQGMGDPNQEPWLFGEPSPPKTKMNTHEKLDIDEYRQDITDSDMEGAAMQIESRLTLSSTEDGEEKLTINMRPVKGKGGVKAKEGEDEEFEVMGNEDSAV